MLIRDLPLVDASVPLSATLIEAARVLSDQNVAAIAVLKPDRNVAGLFTDDDVLRGIFPAYVEELHHTAFVYDVAEVAERHLAQTAEAPVSRFMRAPIVVEIGTSALHVAERFLHCAWGALAVVEAGSFVGMLRQVDFVARLLADVEARR
jgi:CBS-domain-containing membrane protein